MNIFTFQVSSVSTIWRAFTINWHFILSKTFPASTEMIIWFLFFDLWVWCITLIDLCILKHPCIPGISPTWSWQWPFQCVAGFCLLLLCWGFLSLWESVTLGCNFLFLWYLFTDLVWECWWPCRMSLWVFLSVKFFGRVWEEWVLALLFMFDRICFWSRLVLDFCSLEDVKSVSISLCVIGLFIFSISSCSVLESCTFLRVCPFLPGCLFYWHTVAHSSLLWYFIFLLSHSFFYIYNFIDLNPLPRLFFFLYESG